jgi:hypothetical protein
MQYRVKKETTTTMEGMDHKDTTKMATWTMEIWKECMAE